GRCSACSRSTGCRCRITPCSTCLDSPWRAGTASFCASKRTILASISTAHAGSSRRWVRRRCRLLRPRELLPQRTRRTRRFNPENPRDYSSVSSASSVVKLLIAIVAGALFGAACRRDMQDQPKYIPLRESTFFVDQRSARPIVTGTVARGQLREDALLYTGKVNGADATVFPFPIGERLMARGRERFDVFCSPCHGRTGQGDGMVVR